MYTLNFRFVNLIRSRIVFYWYFTIFYNEVLYLVIMSPLVHLQIRNPKDDETPIESATQIFASGLPSHTKLLNAIFNPPLHTSFEIYLLGQTIYFYITAAKSKETFIESLIFSSYPNARVVKTTDPLDIVKKSPVVSCGELVLTNYYHLPIKTYADFRDIDPLSSVLGFMAKTPANFKAAVQILAGPSTFPWQKSATRMAQTSVADERASAGQMHAKYIPNPEKFQITKKTSFQGGHALVRLIAGGPDRESTIAYLSNLAGTFGAFALGEGNQFVFKRPGRFDREKFYKRLSLRSSGLLEKRLQILNAAELATIWHPPGLLLAGVKNIAWGKTLSGEPPENLPISEEMSDTDKKDHNFFAKTEFKNKEQIFGIKTPDRRKHIYIIGKTGAGKSTLIANMAIDDIRRDRGIGIIDPHGDLCDIILDYIPRRRANDVVYLEPFDMERPFHLNILEFQNKEQRDLVASGIVSIFYKIYGTSWGPRLEYILRNVILTLLEIPDATLVEALRLLSDTNYRKQVLAHVQDRVLLSFWNDEFAKMPDKLKAESVMPIQNKVGQFVTSKMIRNIIGHPKSSINLAEIMNEGKILLLNLSQGKLGEDNAALLGAMIITRIQLAAMERSFHKEEDRKDFFLYVDEFQNFATASFIKILSEARKYRLSLTLANQYVDQIDREVSKAIFGNVGTLISFVVGANDAHILSREYGEIYKENDLVSVGKYEVITKLSVDNQTSAPFPAKTLPLPSTKNDQREKIVQLSKEKYGRKATE